MPQRRGVGLHIGLNSVDSTHYQGWSGQLKACEADARDMAAITTSRGLTSSMLLTQAATAEAVTAAVRAAAEALEPGDLFVCSYSGHGGQVRDATGEEPDFLDETWVLWDRQLLDDELYALWTAFDPGVRILVFSDSCHSGSVTRDAFYAASPTNAIASTRFKYLPRDVEARTYEANRSLYDEIQTRFPAGDRAGPAASVLLLSGCQDNQTSRDGERNGYFTEKLREVWADGAFQGTYREFYSAISKLMPPDQTPNWFRVGKLDPAFENEAPFTV